MSCTQKYLQTCQLGVFGNLGITTSWRENGEKYLLPFATVQAETNENMKTSKTNINMKQCKMKVGSKLHEINTITTSFSVLFSSKISCRSTRTTNYD